MTHAQKRTMRGPLSLSPSLYEQLSLFCHSQFIFALTTAESRATKLDLPPPPILRRCFFLNSELIVVAPIVR